jgi:hypothetical protein
MANPKYVKMLRQKIVATAAAKWHWSLDDLHYYMNQWGYGSSLRQMKIRDLQSLLKLVLDPQHSPDPGFTKLDQQGKYMWHLMKLSGWSLPKLKTFWLSKFKTDKFENLEPDQIGATIRVLTKYVEGDVKDPGSRTTHVKK